MRVSVLIFVLTCFGFLQAQGQLERIGTPISWSQNLTVNPDNQNLAQADVEALLGEDAAIDDDRSVPFRFAYARVVDWTPDNSGTWINLPNGDRLWLLGIEYEAAYSIAVTLENLQLPKGGKLYVYSDDRQDYLGPITDEDNRSGELGLPHIKGQKPNGRPESVQCMHGFDYIGSSAAGIAQCDSICHQSFTRSRSAIRDRCIGE